MLPEISPPMASLLAEIEAFCAEFGMSESAFGDRCKGDKHLVRDIRSRNRQLKWENQQDVRLFMAAMRQAA
jgi:hypothetical protein